jgi:hypothetical protein
MFESGKIIAKAKGGFVLRPALLGGVLVRKRQVQEGCVVRLRAFLLIGITRNCVPILPELLCQPGEP